jgi:membrane protein
MSGKTKFSFSRLKEFLSKDVWEIDVTSLSAGRSVPIRIVRIGQMLGKGFAEDDLPIHASALTFVTLMSLVPMLAVAFAVMKGFGVGQERIGQLMHWTQSMPQEFQVFVAQILNIVDTTNFAAMGSVGMVFVIFTAVMVLGSTEYSFNRIWGVTKPRAIVRQAANYISILVLVPFLILIASTAEAWMRGRSLMLPESVGFLVRSGLNLTSLFTTWLAFWFLYTFLPNTRVHILPAILSSLVAALFWMGWQKAYISLQFGVAKYNAIYGTFASVPIFLAWLYTSWVIVLLGVELAFALQNSSTYSMERAAEQANTKSRFMLALSILLRAADNMAKGTGPLDTVVYAREHRVPVRLLNEMLRVLVRAGFLAQTADKESTFALLKAPDSIRVKDVVDFVSLDGAQPESLGLHKLEPSIVGVIETLDKGMAGALGMLTIQDLLQKNGEERKA